MKDWQDHSHIRAHMFWEDRKSLLLTIMRGAYNLWVATTTHHAPKYEDLFQEINNPQPGDLVLEVSTFRRTSDPFNGFGYLKSVIQVPYHSPADWEKMILAGEVDSDDINHTRDVYSIRLISEPDKVITWDNCQFIKVITGII